MRSVYHADRSTLDRMRDQIEELRVITAYDEEGREMGDPHLRDSDALKALVFVCGWP